MSPHHYVVHYIAPTATTAAPACGDWKHAINWTTVRACVTCEECLSRLPPDPTAPGTAPVARNRPVPRWFE